MRIEKIRAICEPEVGQERNKKICKDLDGVDEVMIYNVDRHILNLKREKNPLQNIDEILGMNYEFGKGADGVNFCNTWPFGTKTAEIFPKFLAVCRGKQRLSKVMDIVLKQSQKIADYYRYDDYARKTVLVLTDKWDVAIFKKYEKKLLEHAVNDEIWYIFLLVTEYGYTQIPFLPNDRNALKGLRGENIENDITLEDMLMRLDEGIPVVYSMTGGTWRPYGGVEYTFDVVGMWWKKESMEDRFDLDRMRSIKRSMEEGQRKGRIRTRALKRFLESTSWIADIEGNIVPKSRALDSLVCTLRMYGKKIEWDSCFMDEIGDERIIKLQEAIDWFIEECERET